MIRALAAALVSSALSATADARACTPHPYTKLELAGGSMAAQMVRHAATIELMRVGTSEFVMPASIEIYGGIYRNALQPVEVLMGESRGELLVFGIEPQNTGEFVDAPNGLDWNDVQLVRRAGTRDKTERWEDDKFRRMLILDAELEPNPNVEDDGVSMCSNPLTFIPGALHLAFRDEAGVLLGDVVELDAFDEEGARRMVVTGPRIERIFQPSDAWLVSVNAEIERQRVKPRP